MTNRRTFLKATFLGVPFLAVSEASAITVDSNRFKLPLVVSTWDSGVRANAAAWKVLKDRGRAIDAVEQAAISAEAESSCCVGLEAFPDRDGKVTLDASIMDHKANCGSVAFLQQIKHPISVARKLMENTKHVFLAGDGALQFAIENGFERMPAELSPPAEKAWKEWLEKSDYKPIINIENTKQSGMNGASSPSSFDDGSPNHDTMGTIAIDAFGDLSGACTTSGMAFKMHGRVGDSPIIGAGLFVDNKVGAATSSGVGEEVIRICGTHTVIEAMRGGKSPTKACEIAIKRIVEREIKAARDLQVGFVAISKRGEVGAFAIQKGFTYSVTNYDTNKTYTSISYFK